MKMILKNCKKNRKMICMKILKKIWNRLNVNDFLNDASCGVIHRFRRLCPY